MNPNLDRAAAYLRIGRVLYEPKVDGRRGEGVQYISINAAKAHSRELTKMGYVVVTKE